MSQYFDGLVRTLTEPYGIELGLFLAKRLGKRMKNCECIDNLRFADKADLEQVVEYERQRDHGCCGFVDMEIKHHSSGRTFILGFNHGH